MRGHFIRSMLKDINENVRKVEKRLGPYKFEEKAREPKLETRQECLIAHKTFYKGEWIKETKIRQGHGRLVHADGSVYEGTFTFNKPSGKGRMIFASGDVYEG